MQLYRTTYNDKDKGKIRVWTGSLSEASKARTAAKQAGDKHPVSVPVDVPTKKEELIAWLNGNT